MTDDDKIRIERALRRQAEGFPLDTIDQWVLQAHERRERARRERETRVQRLDTMPVDDASALFDAEGNLNEELVDAVGYALSETSHQLRKEIDQLRAELAEQRGEPCVWRDVKAAGKVIDLPKMNWRRGNAA
jgi:hypothetical protein